MIGSLDELAACPRLLQLSWFKLYQHLQQHPNSITSAGSEPSQPVQDRVRLMICESAYL